MVSGGEASKNFRAKRGGGHPKNRGGNLKGGHASICTGLRGGNRDF